MNITPISMNTNNVDNVNPSFGKLNKIVRNYAFNPETKTFPGRRDIEILKQLKELEVLKKFFEKYDGIIRFDHKYDPPYWEEAAMNIFCRKIKDRPKTIFGYLKDILKGSKKYPLEIRFEESAITGRARDGMMRKVLKLRTVEDLELKIESRAVNAEKAKAARKLERQKAAKEAEKRRNKRQQERIEYRKQIDAERTRIKNIKEDMKDLYR